MDDFVTILLLSLCFGTFYVTLRIRSILLDVEEKLNAPHIEETDGD